MKALGIISFEDTVATVDGLGDYRPVPAIAILGRYRVIDFVLSNMTNSGIDNVQVYCKEKPRNLIEHLGNGSVYNINSKRGKLRILYGEKSFSSPVYNTDIANYSLNMQYIESDHNPYVVVAPSYFMYSLDYSKVLEKHLDTGADITVVYTSTNDAKTSYLGCDVLTLDKTKKVTAIEKNRGNTARKNVSMEAYVLSKKLFIELVNKSVETSSLYWFKDILKDSLEELDVRGYQFKGYVACINSLAEYFNVSMQLRDREVAGGLFKPGWPIYTQTNDSSPTKYEAGSKVTGSVVANGSVIEGTVENCVVSRGVTVRKGAVVKNSIILPGAYIGEKVKLDHVVVDKYAIIHHVKALSGTDDAPIYVKRRDRI